MPLFFLVETKKKRIGNEGFGAEGALKVFAATIRQRRVNVLVGSEDTVDPVECNFGLVLE